MTRERSYQICRRCVCDTTISSICFDETGICQFCKSHDKLEALYPRDSRSADLEKLAQYIKSSGRGRDFDCIVGVSGGTDSSYTLKLVKELGLRPLAVHFDNGWNTTESVTNIKNLISKLGVELHTHVVDWEEFKDLQKAFLKASVPCIEAPTDVGIHGTLYRLAEKEGLKYILGGQSFRSEGTVPREWSYLDGTYITSVHKRFGTRPLKSFPNVTLPSLFRHTFWRGIRQIPFLNYFDYSKPAAKEWLTREMDWTDYGGHHYENQYSKFAFGWYQFRKFKIDKRIISLSGPVRSGELSRDAALAQLSKPPFVEESVVDYVRKKLDLSSAEFTEIMQAPPRSYHDYFTSEDVLKYMRLPILAAVKMGYLTPVLYEKYFES